MDCDLRTPCVAVAVWRLDRNLAKHHGDMGAILRAAVDHRGAAGAFVEFEIGVVPEEVDGVARAKPLLDGLVVAVGDDRILAAAHEGHLIAVAGEGDHVIAAELKFAGCVVPYVLAVELEPAAGYHVSL